MLKRAFYVCALVAGLAGLATTSARAVTVDVYAKENSSSGGAGAIGGSLTAGQGFTVTVAPDDLWNAGPLPRWSNANGLIANLYATGTDESGETAGTLIGENFAGGWTQGGFNAPYGSLVGRVGSGAFFLIGTSYTGTADASGQLSLYYWDSNNGDNTGFITATIDAAAVPGPIVGAGLPGLVMALGGLVILSRRRRNQSDVA
jgi:hypothetical protein